MACLRAFGLEVLLVGIILVSSSLAQNSCQYDRGVPGICRDIRLCPSVLRDLQNRVRFPVRCGSFINGRFPAVCCPADSGPGNPPQEPDISEPSGNLDCGRTFGALTIGDVRSRRAALEGLQLVGPGRVNQPSVVGGIPSLRTAWPWMALLGFRDGSGNIDWFCAGVLINNQWILTAAHCFDERTVNVVRLGEHDYEDPNDGAPHQDLDVDGPIRHPDYAFPQAYNDLALMKLRSRVTFQDFIRPVCLPWGTEIDRNLEGNKVTLTGWGDTLFGGRRSSVLQQVQVTVFPTAVCDRSYQDLNDYSTTWPRGIGAETICSGDRQGGKDACQGDSGGPIVSKDARNRYTIAGVVSNGFGCGAVDFPGLYVNIRRPEYLAWIKRVAF